MKNVCLQNEKALIRCEKLNLLEFLTKSINALTTFSPYTHMHVLYEWYEIAMPAIEVIFHDISVFIKTFIWRTDMFMWFMWLCDIIMWYVYVSAVCVNHHLMSRSIVTLFNTINCVTGKEMRIMFCVFIFKKRMNDYY